MTPRLGPRTRLLLTLGVILVLSFLFLSYINFITIRRSLRNEISSSTLPLTRENIYSDILKDLMPPMNVSASMANDAFLINWITSGERETGRVVEYLSKIKREFGYFSAFFVSSRTGAYYHSDGILKFVSRDDEHDGWFYNFISSGDRYDLDVDTNEAAQNRLTIFVNHRLEDLEGNLLGVTGVGIEMKSFSAFLAERQTAYEKTIYLADPSGIIQAHPDTSLVETNSMFDREGLSEIAPKLLEKRQEPVDASYEREHTRVLVTSRYMPEFDWFIIVEQSEDTVLGAPRRNLLRTLLVGLLTSLCILVVSILTVNHYQTRLQRLATTDELTGLANRREFEHESRRNIGRFERGGSAFSLILIDIDRFKEINDRSGHLVGDEVLGEISRRMIEAIRPTDVLARWGGDEFILLSECPFSEAMQLAERLRSTIERQDLAHVHDLETAVTISCGVTEYAEQDTLESAVGRADEALYTAKGKGRNVVSGRRETGGVT